MSGHSKWNTIKRKKGETDSSAPICLQKLARNICFCKRRGADPSSNAKLRELIAKAKANNVPNENVDRIIKKALGEGDKNDYFEISYEGYGPSGVAVLIERLPITETHSR
jgi:transcriptional/translational regulatory protein YebC/TACO1